jgi:hypothetical protein
MLLVPCLRLFLSHSPEIIIVNIFIIVNIPAEIIIAAEIFFSVSFRKGRHHILAALWVE